jgi:argininosuccinate lyase
LVRIEGLSFREAHGIVAATVQSGDDTHTRIVDDVLLTLGPAAKATRDQLLRALDPVAFVEVRSIVGGPARAEVSKRLQGFADNLRSLESWAVSTGDRISKCSLALHESATEALKAASPAV